MPMTRVPVEPTATVLIVVIKADLDYVSSHWDAATFDLWEEVNGAHFYTRMVFKWKCQLIIGAI
jgi:Glycosyl hydrolases family 15